VQIITESEREHFLRNWGTGEMGRMVWDFLRFFRENIHQTTLTTR
jgi:hypothetical protein